MNYPTNFEEFKKIQAIHQKRVDKADMAFKKVPKDAWGLVLESYRKSSEYQTSKNEWNFVFKEYQNINSYGNKTFKKELAEARKQLRLKRQQGAL